MPTTLRARARVAARALVGLFSEDSAKQAYGLLAGLFPGQAGTPPDRGTRERLAAFAQTPWLHAVADRIATAFASVEWQLYVLRAKGGRARRRDEDGRVALLQRSPNTGARQKLMQEARDLGDLEQITDHVMLDMLDAGNSYHTGWGMRKLWELHYELAGDAFLLKERNGVGAPTAMWPIPPHWISRTPTPSQRSYRVSFRGWHGEIPDTEFLWIGNPNPEMPYGRGVGLAQVLGDEVETDEYAAKYLRQTFLNQARPDFIVFPKEGQGRSEWSDPEAIRLQEQWRAEHQGFWRVAKPKFIKREIGVYEFGEANFRQLQMVQLREFERDTIRQVPGLPPEILGIVEPGASRATIDRAAYMFARFTLVPRLEAFRAALQERLVPEYDERLIVGYASPVEEDREFFLEVRKAAPWNWDVDEWRQMGGSPDLEHGRGKGVFAVPFQISFQQELSEERPPAPAPILPGNGQPPAGASASETRAWRRALTDDARACAAAGDREAERGILRALADDPEDLPALTRLAARLEPRLRREFLRAVEAVRGEVDLEALAQALQSGSVPEVEVRARLAELEGRLVTIPPVLRQGFLVGAQAGAQDLSAAGVTLRFDLVNPRAVVWVGARGAELVREVTEATRQAIRSLVEQAFTEGRDARRTAREIRDVIGLTDRQAQAVQRFLERLAEEGVEDLAASLRAVRYAQAQLRLRSQTIARTEIMTASNAGQDALWQEAKTQGLLDPATTRRVWIATEDDRLEELCEALDGEERGLEEPFTGGVMRPPRHVNCRCSLGLRFVKA